MDGDHCCFIEMIAPNRLGWNAWREFIGGNLNSLDELPDVFRVTNIRLHVCRHHENNTVYIALYVSDLQHELVTINFTDAAYAHITIGTYLVDDWPKMEQKIREALGRVRGWMRISSTLGGMKLWLKTVDASETLPAVFQLRLCLQGWSLNLLVSALEKLFSGRFKTATDLPRTMLYNRGPKFHLSIYGDCTVSRP